MGLGENSGFCYAVFTAVCFLVLLLVQKSYSLNCWECNSKYDPNCADPFQHYTLSQTDCNQRHLQQFPNLTASICRKIVQKVRGEERIIRGCGYLNPEGAGQCINRAGTHQVFMYYCQCGSGDGCNTAAKHFGYSIWSSSMYALLAMAAAAKF